MFNLSDKVLIRSCYKSLESMWKNHRNVFIELFFQEKDVLFKNEVSLELLLKTKLIKKINNKFRANVFIFPLSGKFIVCDFLISLHRVKDRRYLRRRDDVWPIFAYESPYIAKKTIVEKGDYVLDLATGSGIIALFCADRAKRVIGTDINPKAINYAQFNAILNNLEDKVEFRLGNLFEPVEGEKFDLIIWNGPTIATPAVEIKYPIYCFGGADGLAFTRRFIQEAPHYLTAKGRMQWLDPSVGDDINPQSLEIVKEIWKDKKFNVIYEQRVKPSPLYDLYEIVEEALFKPSKGLPRPLWIEPLTNEEYSDWLKYLKKNSYTHIHAGIYEVYPSTAFKVIKTKPDKILFPRMNYLPQDWHFLSSSRIRQLLKICESY